MKAKGTIQAILTNPEGIFVKEIALEYDKPEALPLAHKQVLASFLQQGMWRTLSDTEHEYIPPTRIARIIIQIDAAQIELADNVESSVDAAAALNRVIELGKR